MSIFRVVVAQINSIVGDLGYNTRKITDWISEARDMGADLIAFPEMAITGYPPEDLLLKPSFLADNMTAMKQVISMSHDIAVVVGFADVEGIHRYNAAAFAYNGDLIHVYHKMYLPNYGVFDEDRYFYRGNIFPTYLLGTTSVAVNICEDIWYPEGPTTSQANSGADIIVNINASPFHVGKLDQRRSMLTERAANNKVHIVYVNMVGGQDELVFDGGSMVFKDNGDLLLAGKQFQEEFIVADIDFNETDYSSLEYGTHDTSSTITTSTIVVPEYYSKKAKSPITRKDTQQLSQLEEIYAALVLGTADYVRKNLFDSVVIGLSGGIDSSLTACIAVDAIGPGKVIGVAMPSRYSSDGSLDDSKELANNLGIRFLTIPIELAHTAYQDMLSPYFPDLNVSVADENIQARVRGNILMAISNIMGSLVLTTANKSETALGYSTLYGDMAGGFAVIKDIPKTLVYQLSMWRDSRDGTEPLIPGQIFTKAPSAELRPGQRDQDTLPPYDVLDKIIKAYVEDECGFHEMLEMGFVPDVVKSILFLIDKNEYKRRQAPPGIKITSRAFGKDRRLPIVNRYKQF